MKKIKVQIIILYIINFILIGFIIFSNKGQILNNNKITLKNLSESIKVNDLNKTIERLNNSHTEYANHIQTSKQKIANAINRYQNNNATEKNDLEEFASMINNLTNIPDNTYYYEKGTEGDSSTIKRYKKIGDSYYVCNANGIVLEDASAADVSSITLVPYNASIAGNISAGSAGYASGSLYLGDGSDNEAYVETGYLEGYTQGIADGLSKVNIQYTYHQHTGSETSGGGCYTQPETEPVYQDCYHEYDRYEEEYNGLGDLCHFVYYGRGSICGKTTTGINSPKSRISHKEIVDYKVIGYTPGCGKTTDTIESATIIY